MKIIVFTAVKNCNILHRLVFVMSLNKKLDNKVMSVSISIILSGEIFQEAVYQNLAPIISLVTDNFQWSIG